MSTPEQQVIAPVEIGSKVKVTRNAKGDPQWEITVREDVEPGEVERLRDIAVSNYRALEQELAK